MKKILIFMMFVIVLSGYTYADSTIPQLSVNVDIIQFNEISGYPFVDSNGRVQVPVRQFAEVINANVSWDQTTSYVAINKNQEIILIPIGKDYYEKNGRKYYMDTASVVQNGRTYLPLRAIAEALDYSVTWDQKTQFASLSTGDETKFTIQEGKVPLNQYRAYYYKTEHPGTVVFTEITDAISVNAAYDFKGIDAQHFSGTWIGDFEFKEDIEKNIDIALSWATVSLKIDDEPVYSKTYKFTKGKHRIQVDYSNNWHTIGFLLQFNDPMLVFTESETTEMLKPFITMNTAIEYVGVYESSAEDHSIEIDITDENKPVILFLSSYSPINWKVTNSGNAAIKAIVVNSFEDGGTVTLENGISVPVVRMPNLVRAYTTIPSYDKVGHGYHFENEQFAELRTQIQNVCGMPLSGFTGVYGEAKLTVPGVVMNEENTKIIDDRFAEIERLKAEEPQKPSNLFGKDAAGNSVSWSSQFDSQSVPMDHFMAYYFNTMKPNTVIGTELVDRVGISYAWSDYLGIDSNDFGAYYVGNFTFDSDTVRNISLAQQWSFTRVLIDGQVVFDENGHNSGMLTYTFTKGVHKIEVEHINDWHTVGFSADFDLLPISSIEEVKAFASERITSDTKVYATMIYESAQRDMSCKVTLPNVKQSEFLVLNSLEPVHWTIDTSAASELKGVILTSNFNGSTVEFIGGPSCEVIRGSNVYADIDYLDPSEKSISENSNIYQEVLRFMKSYGIDRIDGVSGYYEAQTIEAGNVKVLP